MANGNFGGGNGSPSNPFLIEDANDFYNIRLFPTASFRLINSINLAECTLNKSGFGWDPISFGGLIDGCGFTISSCRIDTKTNTTAAASYQGLFSYLWGRVRNLKIEDFNIYGHTFVGIIAGQIISSEALVENVAIVNSLANAYSYIGSVAGGMSEGLVKNIYSNVSINVRNTARRVGGLIGTINSITNQSVPTIQHSYFFGEITGQSFVATITGALIGERLQIPTIIDSYFLDTIGFNNGLGTPKIDSELRDPATFLSWSEELINSRETVWSLTAGKYPRLYFETGSNFLIYGNNKYFTLQNFDWVEVAIQGEPTGEDFNLHGFNEGQLSSITEDIWNKIQWLGEAELINCRNRYKVNTLYKGYDLINPVQTPSGFITTATIDLTQYGESINKIYFKY